MPNAKLGTVTFDVGRVVEEIKKHEGNFGYNAKNNKYEDLVGAGIIDPTKVTRSALQNAASISSLLLTTESVVAEIPKDKDEAGAMNPGMAGGMPMM